MKCVEVSSLDYHIHGVYDTTGNAIRRPISPVDVLEGVDAVISCLEAVLENEDHSDPDS